MEKEIYSDWDVYIMGTRLLRNGMFYAWGKDIPFSGSYGLEHLFERWVVLRIWLSAVFCVKYTIGQAAYPIVVF